MHTLSPPAVRLRAACRHAAVTLARRTADLAALCAGVLLAVSGAPAVAGPTCSELAYANARHGESMDALARLARLPGGTWNRYHETLVAGLCEGRGDAVRALVDDGSVPTAEAERIAAVIGKPYRARPRAASGKRYAAARAQFADMGACSACADNIAQFYVKKPASQCARLAARAISGDAQAVGTLVEFPDYCAWKY
jgi:hypothetical protein